MTDPPKYDVLFQTQDYSGNKSVPVNARFVVSKDGVLTVQYTKIEGQYGSNYWPKLYRFDAKTQQVSELSFGYPEDMDKITGVRTDIVEPTKGLKLSIGKSRPIGYEPTNENYRHGGLRQRRPLGFRRPFRRKPACARRRRRSVKLEHQQPALLLRH